MSYSLSLTSASVNSSGQLILTLNNGSTLNAGSVVGAAGASGDLFYVQSKSASYTLVSSDVTGTATPVFVVGATAGNVVITLDAALLWNGTSNMSFAVMVKRDPTDTSTNTVTVAAKSGQTIENVASITEPNFFSYTVLAKSATALLIV